MKTLLADRWRSDPRIAWAGYVALGITLAVLPFVVDSPATFAIVEPAGRCCGRALHALAPGADLLLFLEHRSTGFHLAGGSRGAVAATPAVIAHVRGLLAATTEGRLARFLATATLHEVARVRTDASLHFTAIVMGSHLK